MALKSLATKDDTEKVHEVIMAAGALLPIIRLLDSSSGEVQQEAILVLMIFHISKNFATLIVAADAIPVLHRYRLE